jgi:hypothetical protein
VGTYVKLLRGEVQVTHSLRLDEPSWHLDPACPGLERVPEEARGQRVFADVFALGLTEDGRPCRMCCLERLLRTVLPARRGRAAVYATLSGETADRGPFPGFDPPSENGVRRLLRVARHTGLRVNPAGTATFLHGWVNQEGLAIAERNLRTYRIPVEEDEESLSVFWALLRDEPGADRERAEQLLATARLLSR